NVERRQPLRLDPLELVLLEIGERDVVAMEEGEPEVVVLDVETPAHAARQLVDEAEHALVAARVDLPRPRRLELEAQVGPRPPEQRRALPSVALQGKPELLLARMEVEIDDVAESLAVDGHDAVTGAEGGASGGRALPHRGHHHPGGRGASAGGQARGRSGDRARPAPPPGGAASTPPPPPLKPPPPLPAPSSP